MADIPLLRPKKPQKPKYALVFIPEKQEQSTVLIKDIEGEPTVGEYRMVQWSADPKDKHKVKIVVTGKSFCSLSSF